MNVLRNIDPDDFVLHSFSAWEADCFLLCVGDMSGKERNLMAVGWGFFGTMWGKPMAVAAVRPQRFSASLLERFETFSLCAVPHEFRENLIWCGRHSGSEGDKFAASGFTPVPGEAIAAPVIAQASLVVECRKLYMDEFKGRKFTDKQLARSVYPDGDFHLLAYGEIVALRGTAEYSSVAPEEE